MGLFNGSYKDYGMSKNEVLAWQKALTGNPSNKVLLSKQQLQNNTQMIIDDHDRIIQDCIRLVKSTFTPEVFFNRYDLLIQEMSDLIKFEHFYPFKKSISEQVIILKNNRAKNEIAFINKFYEATIEDANNLKTQRGQMNRINNFFDVMNKYKSRMTSESKNHLESLYVEHISLHENIKKDGEIAETSNDNIPRWQRIPTREGYEEDKQRITDMKKVCLCFKNGILYDVIPDVYGYPASRIYNVDGIKYDLSNIDDVNKIPIPNYTNDEAMLGSPTHNLEYQLRICAVDERKSGNQEIAYALMKKGTEMMFYSKIEYLRHDYLRFYFWMLEDGKIEDAKNFFESISKKLPSTYSEKEHIKEIQHLNYALLKQAFPEDMPKSFSAYMRNYNAKNDKFAQYQGLAKEIGIRL